MSSTFIKDYQIYNLQKEYTRYSNVLYNLQIHINRLYSNGILNINEKNNHLKVLNDILHKLNNNYNKSMMDICNYDSDYSEDSDNNNKNDEYVEKLSTLIDVSNINNSNYDDICCLLSLNKSIYLSSDEVIKDPFSDINSEILKLCYKIGFFCIYDALNIIVGDYYDKLYDSDTISHLNVYNRIFVPIKY